MMKTGANVCNSDIDKAKALNKHLENVEEI